MKDYLVKHPWKIIEKDFHPEYNKITESIFSIGNGYMGQRANFEEDFSGHTMRGSYIAGIYYPDKTRVGWWKNGYPEYFAKVLNSVNWIGISLSLDGEIIDLNKVEMMEFERELDMQHSLLSKSIKFKTSHGYVFHINSERFCSRRTKELGCISYSVRSENYNGKLTIDSFVDFDVHNEDSNYDEQFWTFTGSGLNENDGYVQSKTKKTGFDVLSLVNNQIITNQSYTGEKYTIDQKAGDKFIVDYKSGQSVELVKKVIIVSSFYNPPHDLEKVSTSIMDSVRSQNYNDLKDAHTKDWIELWRNSDIVIEGDVSAQQGIRFNIFHLHQTYSGEDERLNIGPKGFTGEKYGGSTYWDTEAYCVPFYLANSDKQITRNLLLYRYKHLRKAIENAEKLGFKDGAALYPMVTMNGEECHNEWEITFEEIHRNGAIAYAILDYTRYTGDNQYLYDYGVEVLVGIARFWSQRVNWSGEKSQYVMLGVTGPNEYENNVNNNWYTNYLAVWCLKYTLSVIKKMELQFKDQYEKLIEKTNLESSELTRWEDIISKMYFPYDTKRKVYLQQDGFLDKELIPVKELDRKHLPLNQNWSWDRILRSCYIKQADVLQGMYFFEDDFTLEDLKRNFNFYEPLTVHESSLSPCVHSILACRISAYDKAYEMYLRTARLDLDDYNNDTEDGLHITSMAGTWMSIVKGFGGMKIVDGLISFNPYLPEQWDSYAFKILYRGNQLSVQILPTGTKIENINGGDIEIIVNDVKYNIISGNSIIVNQ